MGLRRQKEETAERWLDVDSSMTGTMTFKDPVNLRINAQFEGTLETKGKLVIGEKAQVRATIQCEAITIAGSLTGQVTATSRAELQATGRVTGKVISPRVVMHEGAVLQGSLEMMGIRQDERWMTVEELARYLEVDAATVGEWAQNGRLPAQRDQNEWRFEREKIEEWLAHERIK